VISAPKSVIIIGGLGNGSVIAAALDDAARRGARDWAMAGYLNDRLKVGDLIEGYPVLGGLDQIQTYLRDDYFFIYTIYRIDGPDRRVGLFGKLSIPDERLATFIHPAAYVAPNAVLGPGCIIMPQASISANARLGRCNLVMVNATIGHNSEIGDFCHIAAQSCISSFVRLGRGVHVGLNATIREGLNLGDYSTVAMGAVLLNDIGEYEIWAGVPAKMLRLAEKEM
jgi:acetyltransferase EpsM